jgi:hypothetical protein
MSSDTFVPCPQCGQRVKTLNRHLKRFHKSRILKREAAPRGESRATTASPSFKSSSDTVGMIFIGCPLCREPIPEVRALLHLKSCVGAERRRASWLSTRETRPVRPAKARPRKHPLGKKRGGKCGPSSPPAHGHLPDPSSHARIERAHDATRDFAHSFRDRGQFGSHPSHDGFGDDDHP